MFFNHLIFQYFPTFIDQQIKKFEEENDSYTRHTKPVKEYCEPTLINLNENYYLVAGREQIYLLNYKKTEDNDSLGMCAKLTNVLLFLIVSADPQIKSFEK